MTQVQPTKEFIAYVQAAVLDEVQRTFKLPSDVFANKFWAAAEFDWFRQTGACFRLVDGGGLCKTEAEAYKLLLDVALQIRASGEVSEVGWNNYFRRLRAK